MLHQLLLDLYDPLELDEGPDKLVLRIDAALAEELLDLYSDFESFADVYPSLEHMVIGVSGLEQVVEIVAFYSLSGEEDDLLELAEPTLFEEVLAFPEDLPFRLLDEDDRALVDDVKLRLTSEGIEILIESDDYTTETVILPIDLLEAIAAEEPITEAAAALAAA